MTREDIEKLLGTLTRTNHFLNQLPWSRTSDIFIEEIYKAIALLQAELDKPGPEPVAWMNPMNNVVISTQRKKQVGTGDGYPKFSVPIYTKEAL